MSANSKTYLPSAPDPNVQTGIDMANARRNTSFDVSKVNAMLNEGHRDLDMRKRVIEICAADKILSANKKERPYLSRAERLSRGLEITKRLFELVDEHDWDYIEFLEALFASDEHLGIYLHEIAFQPVIQSQGSDEQHAVWLPKCLNHEILGCYAQTELGHGSNVQRLETTATFVQETQEFEIHSPTITSTKWWIGGLGLMATHSVVQCRLIVKGKDLGPHLFIVPLRSMDTHQPLPGRTIGEIGPKAHGAFASLDNGYIRFDKVRIPRENMLNRFANITPEGQYIKPPHDKLSYGGMIFIRANMIGNCGWAEAKAITTPIRYCHVRRQFADPDAPGKDAEEIQVINYPSVYMRLLPVLAESYVFITMGKDMINLFSSMASQLASGNTELLAETHAVSAGLKSYVTARIIDAMETGRRAMGGHGFMHSAAVGQLYAANLPGATYEGDNYILNVQVARSALKTLTQIRKNPKHPLTPSTAYLKVLFDGTLNTFKASALPTSSSSWLDPALCMKLLSLRAAFLVQRIEYSVQREGKKWGDLSWDSARVARAVVEVFIALRVTEAIEGDEGLLVRHLGAKERRVIKTLINFYLLNTIEGALPDLFEFGILPPVSAPSDHLAVSAQTTTDLAIPLPPSSPPQIPSIASPATPISGLRAAISALALTLLPDSIGLSDAFGFTDWDLDSALGRSDGKVYEELLRRALEANENGSNAGDREREAQNYEKFIKPVLERGKRLSNL